MKEKKEYIFLAALLAVSVLAYINIFSNSFIGLDDKDQILNNPWITKFGYIKDIFTHDVSPFQADRFSNYYRPLFYTTFIFIYKIFKFNVWGWHLFSVLFNSANIILVYFLVRTLLKGLPSKISVSLLAFIAAALFALHPVHTEAVNWVSALPDLLYTFFYLLSFLLYTRQRSERIFFNKYYVASLVLFFFALLSKEPAVTLILVVLLYEYFEKKDLRSINYKKIILYLLPLGIYLALRINALHGFTEAKAHQMSFLLVVINAFALFKEYLLLLIAPVRLNLYHSFKLVGSLTEINSIIGLATILFIVSILYYFRKNKYVLNSFAFLLIPLMPALYVPALNTDSVIGERYLYLPSIGFLLVLVLALNFLANKFYKARHYVYVLAIVLCVSYFYASFNRNFVWNNDLSLSSDAVSKSEGNAQAHSYRGLSLLENGYLDESVQQFGEAIKLNNNLSEAHLNLGVALQLKGMVDDAITEYKIVSEISPRNVDCHNNLGLAYQSKGDLNMAISEYKIALSLNPMSPEAYNNLGLAYKNMGLIDDAIEFYQKAVNIRPDQAGLYYNLANAYRLKGQEDMAAEYERKGMELESNK